MVRRLDCLSLYSWVLVVSLSVGFFNLLALTEARSPVERRFVGLVQPS